ncbi:TetR family transcriptional regulator [Kribbella hippodromi]|uniref:TetR family transcriptional regulator n=1 Tax=Kribbella hippodromi TaxID=434347 RepID=A0ABN2DLF3_9ACTN
MASGRMTRDERRAQVLGIAEEEFAIAGLYGASTETIARRAGITQAYVFRLFGTKKQLFLACVDAAFGRMATALLRAARGARGIEALAAMGQEYYDMLSDRTTLLLQLQGTAAAAAGDGEVRDAVRASFARLWQTVAQTANLDPVTIKAFLAFGMLLNTNAALDLPQVDEPWSHQARTLINPGLFTHITTKTNQ